MRFAVLSTLSLITGHLTAGAAVPETEKRDIVLETIIHGDTQEIFDHAPDSVVLQKGDDDIKPKCQDYGHSCTYGQCCDPYHCVTIIFGAGGWCW
ncbi:uncharacterized protein GGS25DRAFT_519009 [Hypoxylon fragiforme]|uniref:uncharacterized protein n=1 Tax=Hypoxylon fragiforme TaxID=63214 RepID=UPI0020C6903F|nr:uncharacterized protein GGS25DRAFT_519009 [Hypoxylon fragiforme]KAI2610713.1 hypothetical protein GGS25DRAFT_519009 [Hypoxylon fragiforme]